MQLLIHLSYTSQRFLARPSCRSFLHGVQPSVCIAQAQSYKAPGLLDCPIEIIGLIAAALVKGQDELRTSQVRIWKGYSDARKRVVHTRAKHHQCL